MGIKVALRRKNISKGRQSLYLDFYPAILDAKTGAKTRREFLGLYILMDKSEIKGVKGLKPLTPLEKEGNFETIRIAESIRQKRENELNKPEIYTGYEKEQLRIKALKELSFVDYFEKLAAKRSSSNHDNWIAALKHIKSFAPEGIKFGDLTEQYLNEFKEYLLTRDIATNTAVSYFNKFKASLKQAYKDGVLAFDLNSRVSPIKAEDTNRQYLTLDELNKLVNIPCNEPMLKRAALFSALTGLRFSDIQKLTWKEVEYIDGQGYFLNFRQKKTKDHEYLPISEQAYSFLGERGNPDDRVFAGLTYSAYQNKHLYQWIGAAGITKDITFHCFRHTFVALQLFNGTDIYTVSKMLGHRSLKTTQIYGHIVDEAKRKAADSIKLNLNLEP
jgi:integrase